MALDISQMTFTLSNNYGDSEALSGPIYVSQIDGIGLVSPRRHVERGPQQHGQTLNISLLSPRTITMRLGYYASTGDASLGGIRERLHWIFNMVNEPAFLDCARPDGAVRRFDCYYRDGLTGKRAATDPYGHQYEVLQLVCDNPLPYEWPLGLLEFAPAAGYYYSGAGLHVPLEVPVLLGPAAISETKVLQYQGSWEDYPIVRFEGPMASPYIENLITHEKLQFQEGTTINEGDWWEVDCRYGYKYVVDSVGTIQTQYLTEDTDLATFHIAPHPIAPAGQNSIRAAALACGPSSKITVQYITYWFGI